MARIQSPQKRPNLFDHAPSELSQDAILAWLIEWADPLHREANPVLHEAGATFVRALLGLDGQGSRPFAPAKVKVILQWKGRIDLLVLIDDDRVLVIEDKIHASESGTQTEEYPALVEEEFSKLNRSYVYLKTGDQGRYDRIRRNGNGWRPFTRKMLIETLDPFVESANSDILTDFMATLRQREYTVQAFRATPPSSWEGAEIFGWYSALLEELRSEADWSYVPNQSGGFFSLWLPAHAIAGVDEGSIYVQIAQRLLSVRVRVPQKEDRTRVRNLWSARVLERCSWLHRPKPFGWGETMAVAEWPHALAGPAGEEASEGFEVLDPESGTVDVEKTARRIETIDTMLAELVLEFPT